MRKFIGVCLVASPFIGIVTLSLWLQGIPLTIGMFAAAALVMVVIVYGVHLITEPR